VREKKTFMQRVTKLSLGIVAAAATLLVACSNEGGVEPVSEITPEDCVANVEKAFGYGDVNLLKKTLSPDFLFHFNPNDVGAVVNGYTIPRSWTYADFVLATGKMFKFASAVRLAVNEIPAPTTTPKFTAQRIPITILVMGDDRNGGRFEYSDCDLEFTRYATADGVAWRLTGWWDNSLPGYSPMLSIGRLFVYYYTL